MARQVRERASFAGTAIETLMNAVAAKRQAQQEQQMKLEQINAAQSAQNQGALEREMLQGQLRQREAEVGQPFELRKILETAKANAQAKSMFPEPMKPEEQAQQRMLEISRESGQVPEPMGGYSPQERAIGAPEAVQGTARQREVDTLMRMFGKTNSQSVPLVVFDPNLKQYIDTSTGKPVTSVPRGAQVRNVPLTGETLEAQAAARSRGAGTGKNKIILQAQSAQSQINEIFNIADQDLPAFSDDPKNPLPEGTEAIGKGIGRKIGSKFGLDESARSFLETNVGNARQAIRGLGEVGVLTDKDVDDAIKLLPASTDSVTLRTKKRRNLNSLIESKIRVYEQSQGSDQAFDEGVDSSDAEWIAQMEAQGFTVERE